MSKTLTKNSSTNYGLRSESQLFKCTSPSFFSRHEPLFYVTNAKYGFVFTL